MRQLRQIKDLLQRYIVIAKPVVLVKTTTTTTFICTHSCSKKKKDYSQIFCVHFRQVNVMTVKCPCPLPRIDDPLPVFWSKVFQHVTSGFRLLADFNGASGQRYLAFVTTSILYDWTSMPLVLTSSQTQDYGARNGTKLVRT